jgi:hypothetical protein
MTFDRYRYFYTCAFSMLAGHLVAFVDEMVELAYAESTIKIYLSCKNETVGPASPRLNCSNLIFFEKDFFSYLISKEIESPAFCGGGKNPRA